MNVLIRTDIGGNHGMGHAVRMLALARELQRQGALVSFVTATEALRNYVVPFRCYLQAETAPCCPGDVLILDTKAPDWANDDSALWLRRDAGLRVVRIDHPQASPDSCDLLIGPCAHWDAATVTRLRASFGTRFLYGWEYVLLDPAVAHLAPETVTVREQGPIVFAAGGSDPTGALQAMYDATASYRSTQPLVFLHGARSQMLNPRENVQRASGSIIASFDRSWIRRGRLLVTMFGVTCYEALWWQVPQLIYSHTDENRDGALEFQYACDDVQYCHYRGDLHTTDVAMFCTYLSYGLERSAGGSTVTFPSRFDGQGLSRLATAIQLLDK